MHHFLYSFVIVCCHDLLLKLALDRQRERARCSSSKTLLRLDSFPVIPYKIQQSAPTRRNVCGFGKLAWVCGYDDSSPSASQTHDPLTRKNTTCKSTSIIPGAVSCLYYVWAAGVKFRKFKAQVGNIQVLASSSLLQLQTPCHHTANSERGGKRLFVGRTSQCIPQITHGNQQPATSTRVI